MVNHVIARNLNASKSKTTARKPAAPSAATTLATSDISVHSSVLSLARQLHAWAGSALGMAGTMTDLSLFVVKSKVKKPAQKAALEKVGSLLGELRHAAGLSLDELGAALDLKEPSFLNDQQFAASLAFVTAAFQSAMAFQDASKN